MTATQATIDARMEAALPPLAARPSLGYRILRAILKPLAVHCLVRVTVTGRENFPKGAYVAIANHLSFLDGPLLLFALPASPRVRALADVRPFIGNRLKWWFVRKVAGLIPVDRSRRGYRRMREQMSHALSSGCSALIFPEGRLGTREGELVQFHKGFAHFAAEAAVPIVPIGISGTRRAWLFKRVKVSVGPAFEAGGRGINEIVADGMARVQSLLVHVPESRGPKLFRHQMSAKRSDSDLSAGQPTESAPPLQLAQAKGSASADEVAA